MSREKRHGCVIDGCVHVVNQHPPCQSVDCYVQVSTKNYNYPFVLSLYGDVVALLYVCENVSICTSVYVS